MVEIAILIAAPSSFVKINKTVTIYNEKRERENVKVIKHLITLTPWFDSDLVALPCTRVPSASWTQWYDEYRVVCRK